MNVVDAHPASPLEAAETKQQVLMILDGLPERQRLALEWKYVEDLRVREIADRWGESEKAVEATLYRARREFRRRFGLAEPSSPSEVPSRHLPGQQAKIDSPFQ